MGGVMFGNELFDHWLSQKSLEILSKVEKEKITTEEMLVLTLKAQTNHFHHMDEEFRGEFKKIDERFQKVDQRFERLSTILMWQGGIIITLISGLYLKLFLN
jgi:hypothetical protein